MARLLAFAALLMTLLVAGCGGGSSDNPTPEIREAVSQRQVSGTGQQTSTITLRFDRDFELVEGRVPLASRFELDVPDVITGGTRRVLVTSAEVDPGSARTIVIRVGELVPEGARVRIDKRAFNREAQGEIVATITSDLTPGFALLATVAFQPNLSVLLEEPEPAPVTEADRDPAAMRQLLDEHIAARGTNDQLRAAALKRFDEMSTTIVPSPKMRAALAALTGTFADPAIDFLLTSQNCTQKPAALIAFQPPPDLPELLGRSTRAPDGARVISLNPITEGDRLEHLMALLAHEAIHCDRTSGRFEEIAATAFDTFLYMQLLAVDLSLAEANTPLSRDLNVDVVAMINSGRALPESVGVLKSPSVDLAIPGSTSSAASFGDLVVAAYAGLEVNDTPEEALANAYARILAEVAGIAPGNAFDLAFLDGLLGRAMPPAALAAALVAFEMQPVR